MSEPKQQIRFCASRDGVRIAYAVSGSGPPLVRAASFLSHLEFDSRSPIWQPWLEEVGRHHTLLRYDPRGCGLSDREVADLSLERWVADLEAVVDARGLERFPLLGGSQGAAVAIAYAARHPERVTRLVLRGGFARGVMKRGPSAEQVRNWRLMVDIVRYGWGLPTPAFRQVFSSLSIPDATPQQAAWFNDFAFLATSAECAARLFESFAELDVTALARQVRCPTLVLQARGDLLVPPAEGDLMARLIPRARLVLLDSRNHFLLPGEPAWSEYLRQSRAFLLEEEAPYRRAAACPDLTPREAEILELVARGLTNDDIAARLDVQEKTVRNAITRILRKLGVGTRAQAVARARDAGFALPTPDAPAPSRDDAGPVGLSRREREILELVSRGLANDAIASRLALREKTVRNTLTRVFRKLKVTTRAQAVASARDAGLGT